MDTRAGSWEQALDALEEQLALAEDLADIGDGTPPSAWTPPALEGHLPEELRDRAQDLHQRQQRVQERLAGLIARTGRQLDVARKVSGSLRHRGVSTTRPALYIDTTA
jgi:hypothetical protein